MKKFFIFLLLFFFNISIINCFGIEEDWQKAFGGAWNDYGLSVKQTVDGGYVVAGYTSSFNAVEDDFYLVRCDQSGTIQWNKTYGGLRRDTCNDVQQTSDAGFVLVGFTSSSGAGLSDVFLVKTDSSGKMQFSKTYGGNNIDAGSSVQQTDDGGFIIAGYTWSFGALASDVYLVKTDKDGNLVWQEKYGGTISDYGVSVQQTDDGGYIVAGTAGHFTENPKYYLIKTDGSGKLQWSQIYGGFGGDTCYSARQTSDGGYIIAGSTTVGAAGGSDVYIVKTGPSGITQWNMRYGGSKGDGAYSIQQTSDDGYIISGYTMSYGSGSSDVYLIKTDPSGKMLWNTTAGGKGNDLGYSVQLTSDGGYVVAGYTNSPGGAGRYDVYLVKFSEAQLNKAPTADAGPDQTCTTDSTVTLDGSKSTDPDGAIASYSWDFGDATPTTKGKIANHAYTSPGDYTVKLTVTDDKGATDVDELTIKVVKPQTKGSIKINVKDSTNKPISGVAISSTTQPAGQAVLTGETGADGLVLFSNVAAGSYVFSATKSGFTLKTESITAVLDQTVEKTIIIETSQQGQGIPGYGYETIVIGIIIVSLILLNKRRN